MKSKILKLVSLMIIFSMVSLPLLAQDGFDDPLTDVPLDGGLSLLVSAGVGYAVRKLKVNASRK